MNSVCKILLSLLCVFCFQTWAQAAWTKQNSGTLAWLHSVYFINQQTGWIAGSKGTFLTTEDGGATWRQKAHFTEDTIREVYFSDARNGWLLCERDAYNLAQSSPSYLMKTSDGGATWQKVNFTDGRERIASVFFDKKGYGFAIGESGALLAMQSDKQTWKKNPLPIRYLMLGGAFADDSHGSIVGGGGTILFTEDGGASWNPATIITSGEKAKLNSIFFINQRNGWAVGEQGKIYFTMNGGKMWREQNSNVNKILSDVFFLNTAEGFAIGDEGTILHTTTAGNVWNVEPTNSSHKLEKVFFVGQKGYAVGFGGTILAYDTAVKVKDNSPIKPQLQRRNS